MKHLSFFVPNLFGFQNCRYFHRNEGENLRQMVLNHVAKRSSAIVVGGSTFDTELLGHRDLNVLDMVTIPQAFENRICESKDKKVLNGFFSEVMVDSIDS